MRPGQKNRMRGGRGNNNNGGRRGPNPLTRSYESNGPDMKVRGTPQHIAEKYVQLARDAHSSGDTVMAESYLQHAEHYYRIIVAAQNAQQQAYNQANGIPTTEAEQAEDEDEFEVAGSDRFTFRTPQSFQPPAQGGFNGQTGGYSQQPFQPGQSYGDPGGGDQPPLPDAQPPMGEGAPQDQGYQQQHRGDRQQQQGGRRFDRRFGRDRGDRNFGGDRPNADGRPFADRNPGGERDRPQGGDRPPFTPRQEQVLSAAEDQPSLPSFITTPGPRPPLEDTNPPALSGDESGAEPGFRPRRRRRGRGGPAGEGGGVEAGGEE